MPLRDGSVSRWVRDHPWEAHHPLTSLWFAFTQRVSAAVMAVMTLFGSKDNR